MAFLKLILLLIISATTFASEGLHTDKIYQDDSAFLNNKMHECLALVDDNVVQQFNDKGLKINKTVASLCIDNKRSTAQNTALGFALEIQKSKDLSILKKCAKIKVPNDLKIMIVLKKYFISDLRFKHICDYNEP